MTLGETGTVDTVQTAAKPARARVERQPLGFGLKDGRLFEPRQVPLGKACGCVCPGCGEPLVAKHCLSGKVRPYFAHQAHSDCASGPETALHLAAKQVILDAREVYLPALVVRVAAYFGDRDRPFRPS